MKRFYHKINGDQKNRYKTFNITFKYLLALGLIAIFFFAGYLVLYKIIAHAKGDAAVLNISGRQRMLAQRAATFSLILVNSKDINERNKIREKLSAIADTISKNHNRLTGGNLYFSYQGKVPPAVRALYFEPPTLLVSQIKEFVAEIKKLVDEQDTALTHDNPHFQRIMAVTNGELLDSLDIVVNAYQKDSEEESETILKISSGVLGFIMLVLFIEGLFIFRPMTERIREETEQLLESENKLGQFKSTLDQTLDCVFMFDSVSLKFFYVNQGAINQIGYTMEELCEMTPMDIKPEYTETQFKEAIAPLLGGSKPSIRFETIHKHKNGKLIPVEIFLQYITSPNETSRFVAIVRDITERKRNEAELQKAHADLEIKVAERTATLSEANKTLRKEITERKKAEEEVHQSKKKLQQITTSVNEAIIMADEEGKVLFCNPAAERMFGYSCKELSGKKLSEYIIPEHYRGEHNNGFARFKTTGQGGVIGKTVELEGLRKNGEIFPIELALSSIKHGEYWHAIGTIRDITTRKKAENELRESENRYRNMLENMQLVAVILDPDGHITFANDFLLELTGWTREETIGKDWFETFIPLETRDTFRQAFMETITLSEIPTHYENEIISRDGEGYMIWWNSTLLRDAEGGVSGVVNIGKDITERRKAEVELRQAHEETEQLLAAIPMILIGLDPDDHITMWNKEAVKTFGTRSIDVLGGNFKDCGVKWEWDDVCEMMIACRKSDRSTATKEIAYTQIDGKEGYLNLNVTTIISDFTDKDGILILGSDITEHKILESQLGQAQKLESIGQLAAGIAHEINTPTQFVGDNIRFIQDAFGDISVVIDKNMELLNACNGDKSPLGKLVLEVKKAVEEVDMEYLREEVPKAIQASLRGIERVTTIVLAMKDFSHPGAKEKTLIDINKAIESTITVARNEWKYVAELKTDFDPSLPLVPCIPGEFNQVILNLITNASHAISDVVQNSAESKGKITVKTHNDGDFALISISDTGTGIPAAVRDKIFDPFFTTKEVGKGTGQGLNLSHSVIVDKHGGTITVETEEGMGTTFIIRLPLNEKRDNE